MTTTVQVHGCGYQRAPDATCERPPSTHLLVDVLNGGGEVGLFACAEHLANARRTGLVQGEHQVAATCNAGGRREWLLLSGGRTQCRPQQAST